MEAAAGIIAGLLSLVGFIPYVFNTIKGKTRPNRASWLIWLIQSIIITISYKQSGAINTLWIPISNIIGFTVISSLSIKYGVDGWTLFDRFCLISAAISSILLVIFDIPMIVLLLALFIDFMGILPTFKKTYYFPESEDRSSWIIFSIGNIANLFAVEAWTLNIAAYPIYALIVDAMVILLIFVPINHKASSN